MKHGFLIFAKKCTIIIKKRFHNRSKYSWSRALMENVSHRNTYIKYIPSIHFLNPLCLSGSRMNCIAKLNGANYLILKILTMAGVWKSTQSCKWSYWAKAVDTLPLSFNTQIGKDHKKETDSSLRLSVLDLLAALTGGIYFYHLGFCPALIWTKNRHLWWRASLAIVTLDSTCLRLDKMTNNCDSLHFSAHLNFLVSRYKAFILARHHWKLFYLYLDGTGYDTIHANC